MTDFSKLMAEIDEADRALDDAAAAKAAADRAHDIAEARSVALHRALALIGAEGTPEASRPAMARQQPGTPEKAPREACADEIEKAFPASLPLSPEEASRGLPGDIWNLRTIRAALNIVHERRKKSGAVAPAAAALPPASEPAPPGAAPDTDTDPFPLAHDRRGEKAEA